MHVRRVTAVAIGAAALMVTTQVPAMANNVDLTYKSYHHGMWSDSIDRLGACLGGGPGGSYYKAVAVIRPADGVGPSFTRIDEIPGGLSQPACSLLLAKRRGVGRW